LNLNLLDDDNQRILDRITTKWRSSTINRSLTTISERIGNDESGFISISLAES